MESMFKLYAGNIGPTDLIGNTPLHYSCAMGDYDTTKILLQNGYFNDSVNERGCTPFYYACTQSLALAELLSAFFPSFQSKHRFESGEPAMDPSVQNWLSRSNKCKSLSEIVRAALYNRYNCRMPQIIECVHLPVRIKYFLQMN